MIDGYVKIADYLIIGRDTQDLHGKILAILNKSLSSSSPLGSYTAQLTFLAETKLIIEERKQTLLSAIQDLITSQTNKGYLISCNSPEKRLIITLEKDSYTFFSGYRTHRTRAVRLLFELFSIKMPALDARLEKADEERYHISLVEYISS